MYRHPPDEAGRPEPLSQHGIFFDLGDAMKEAARRSGQFWIWTTREGPHWNEVFLLQLSSKLSLWRAPSFDTVKKEAKHNPYKEFDYEWE